MQQWGNQKRVGLANRRRQRKSETATGRRQVGVEGRQAERVGRGESEIAWGLGLGSELGLGSRCLPAASAAAAALVHWRRHSIQMNPRLAAT